MVFIKILMLFRNTDRSKLNLATKNEGFSNKRNCYWSHFLTSNLTGVEASPSAASAAGTADCGTPSPISCYLTVTAVPSLAGCKVDSFEHINSIISIISLISDNISGLCPRGRVLRGGGRGGGVELVRAAELPRARRHRPHRLRPRHAIPRIQPQVRSSREIQCQGC